MFSNPLENYLPEILVEFSNGIYFSFIFRPFEDLRRFTFHIVIILHRYQSGGAEWVTVIIIIIIIVVVVVVVVIIIVINVIIVVVVIMLLFNQ